MLSITKKTDYALIALAYMAEHADRLVSASKLAATFNMPESLLMNILKTLHHKGILQSTRGTKGGYKIAVDLHKATVYDLILAIEGPVKFAECGGLPEGCFAPTCKVGGLCPIELPLKNLHNRFEGFLRDIKLADLVTPAARKRAAVHT